MLAANKEMMDLLKELDPVRIVDRELGTVEIEVPIPAIGLAPALRQVIRIAAQHDVALRSPTTTHDAASPGTVDGCLIPSGSIDRVSGSIPAERRASRGSSR